MRENARVVWIPSFVAFFNTPNLAAAKKAIGVTEKTVRDHVRNLEDWLRRPLMDEDDKIPIPTLDAVLFFPDAVKILELLTTDELNESISRSQVRPDGLYLSGGLPLRIPAATEIGRLLVAFRASLTNTKPAPASSPRTSGASIEMNWYNK